MIQESHNEEQTFETALARLESLVRALETGEKGLEESLSLFEEGIGLVKYCTAKLDEAEQRVKILITDAAGTHEEDFNN